MEADRRAGKPDRARALRATGAGHRRANVPACGTVNKQGGYRCNNCGRFLPANRERRTTGETARYQPAEILMSADQLLDAIVADKGGANAMTALERSLAAKLRDIDVILTLNKNIIVRAGLGVQEGRAGARPVSGQPWIGSSGSPPREVSSRRSP